ncbi:kinase-like protein, partial [Sistotremastrum niveocremeum HHB9708]
KELKLWASVNHANILPFIGICFFPHSSSDFTFSLVSPWMANGTISDYIRKYPGTEVTPLMIQVAEGLTYLHTNHIVHGDLKGSNIFITDDRSPVLADFGVSRLAELDSVFTNDSVMTSTSHNLKGTIRFMAPELFENDDVLHANKATDVWAFGCVLLVSRMDSLRS